MENNIENNIEETKEKVKEETINISKKCIQCGNVISTEEKYCGKCGYKIKRKTKFIKIVMSIVILVGIIFGGLYIYEDDIHIGKVKIKNPVSDIGITEKYLTNNFKENGFDQFDYVKVEPIVIEEINYKNCNKLVIAKNTVKHQGTQTIQVGIILVNRKADHIQSFTINNVIMYMLNGMEKSSPSKASEIAKISAKYIENYGTEFFSDINSDEYKNIVKQISNIIGVNKARQYVKQGFAQNKSVSTNLDYTLLFDKDSALVKYMAFYEATMKYNSKYPYEERIYKYFLDGYEHKDTRDMLEYLYGPAYSLVQEYTVYSMEDSSQVGSYTTLEEAKKSLNIEY